MESFGGSSFDGVGSTVKKKRSNTFRRPRPDSQPFLDTHDHSLLSSTPPSDNVSKVSSDENTGYDECSRKKEFNLNQCTRMPSSSRADDETARKKIRKDERTFGKYDRVYGNGSSKGSNDNGRSGLDSKRCSEGVLAPANWKSTNKVKESSELQSRKTESHNSGGVGSDGIGNESKLKKVKLKVGGVTRTIHAKSTSDVAFGGVSSSIKSSRSSDAPRPRQKLILPDNSDDDNSPPPEKASGLQGVSWTNFSRDGFSLGKREDSSKGKMYENSGKQTGKSEPVRKSKRVPKRRVLDDAFDGSDDEEIHYLERLKTSKSAPGYGAEYEDDDDEGSKKQRRILKVSKSRIVDGEYDEDMEEYGSSRSGKDGKKKSRSNRMSEDTDYFEEDEPASDGEPEAKRKKPRKESVDTLMESKKEISLTTRQRALQSGTDVSSGTGASLIEFPNGLPPAPPRKQKDKLSEVEQQLKKAEAAQRRRMQVEKAARESEAEAIRKILGQDSNRKKREDKNKRRRDELAQEKAANAMTSNTVKWVIGPTGTIVTFPKDVGLPSIFDTKPSSYPPPREKCAGPSCSNTYKYRDSKSNLPLCSLHCYKAIHENMQPVASC
ncbi:nucleolin 1-like isoform X2 [Telopea speciosissima]|uniref:nucleolin 1-like isoform X2 n=1 Tax=Telopea speciosissima TaxID=54955 RepID=UPI001CC3FEE1|nr:nucleolin 1-like isoform X2 [Telopea speciosissima]